MDLPLDPNRILERTESLRELARTLVRDEHLADDLVQEAWLAAVRRPPAHAGALGAWLGKVARNLSVSHHRREEARKRRELARARPEADPSTPADALERFEVLKGLVEIVFELEDPGRSTVILHFFEGLTLAEVAEKQGVSYATARLRLKVALERLRARLDGRFASRKAWALVLATFLAPGELAILEAQAASAGAPVVHQALGGMLAMSAKKLTLCAALALLILSGIAGLLVLGHRPRGREDAVAGRDAPRGAAAAVTAPDPARREEASMPREGETAKALLPISIRGRVTGPAGGVPSARVIALHLEKWNAIATSDPSETDSRKRLDRLRAAYGVEAAAAPETRTGGDGSFAFRGLSAGDYRLLVSHHDHLASVETIVAVTGGAPAVAEIELVRASSIDGRVLGEKGEPIAGALVESEPQDEAAVKGTARDLRKLLDWQEGRAVLDAASATSGPDGSFRLTSLAPSLHALRASHGDHLEGDVRMAPAGSTIVLVLRRGPAVAGRVLDGGGRPIAGALCSLARLPLTEVHRIFDWSGSEREPADPGPKEATTGEDGRFRIQGIAAAPHEITITAGGRAPLHRDVEAAAGDIDLGDLVLPDPLSIAGRVTGPGGRSAAGARVWAGRRRRSVEPANQIVPERPVLLAEAVSDGDGRFLLGGLPPGVFAVRAEMADLADAVVESVASGTADLALALGAGITVHGKVLDAATGSPVGGADVRIGFSSLKTAASDARGAFVVRGIPAEEVHYGNSTVRVLHPDYGAHTANVMLLGRNERFPLEVRLTPDAHDIEGMVRDAEGRPVANAQVWLESLGLESGFTSPGDRTVSGPDGIFRLGEPWWLRHTTVQLGAVVAASHPAFAIGRTGPLDLPETGTPWPRIDVILEEGAVLEGKVLGEGGAPLAGARITVRPARAEPRATQDVGAHLSARAGYSARDGSYRLRGLEPGPVEVTVECLGHAREMERDIELGAAPVRRDFTLGRGKTIRGRVADTEGAPIPGAEVTAIPADAPAPADDGSEFKVRIERRLQTGLVSWRTDEEGLYEIPDLPAGAYGVLARMNGYEPSRAEGVLAGEKAPDIVLPRFSAVRGTVAAAETGAAIPTFTVNVIDRARRAASDANDWRVGAQGDLTFRDPLGRFTYDGLRPGEYELIVIATGFLAFHADVTLAAGEELPIDVRLARGARIEGAVLDAETGAPIASVNVSCHRQIPREELEAALKEKGSMRATMPPPSGMGNGRSGEDGSFVIEGLMEGQYSVSGAHPFYSPRPEMVELGPREARRVELRLQPTGRLEGSVSGLKPAAGVGGRIHYSMGFERLEPREKDDYRSMDEWGVGVDAAGRFQAQGLRPGKYRLVLGVREYRPGKFTEMGPGSGMMDLEPAGPETRFPLGEVEVVARQTIWFQGRLETRGE
jgi:RNA polymerase sigma-70 factor (ECF subfamily)